AKEPKAAAVLAVHSAIGRLIEPLAAGPQPLATWAEPLRAILRAIYGSRQLDRNESVDRYLLKSLEHLADALDRLGHVPTQLQPSVDARQACRIVLAQVAGEGIPPPADPEAIELLGWLDLPLDD